ncbi:hypothetical protein HNV11_12305 [Spirosoma taeanense]|uniref:Uncharacterized protein n=1 Tax=Spirosoma taeanense TaxID=2735870 RepID=A0A6M5YA41_9BACT|nr:hypothetical protein [Spirosoma taeanense]QJW90101.1 hypothetical protein HNV11_12305 [Spirosoma taeanense]
MTTEELKRDVHQPIDSVLGDVTLVDLYAAGALCGAAGDTSRRQGPKAA